MRRSPFRRFTVSLLTGSLLAGAALESYVDGAKAGLDGLAWLAGVVDKKLSHQISKFAEGAYKVATAVNKAIQRPGLVAHNGRLYAAWRGNDQHPRAYMASTVDGVTWTPAPTRVGGLAAAIDGGPLLSSANGKLYATWRGAGGDTGMYGSVSADNGATWSPFHQVVRGSGTNRPPGVAVHENRLHVVFGPPPNSGVANLVTAVSAALPS